MYLPEELELNVGVKFGERRSRNRDRSEAAGEKYHPPQDHLSDPRRNPGGRRPGGVYAGGLGAAPTSAISLCRE